MKIELKSVDYSARLSEETPSFSAKVYIDGKPAGTARNHGTGGPTMIDPPDLEKSLDAYGATLPEVKFSYGVDGSYKQTGETLINEALSDYLDRRDLKRLLASSLLYADRDGNIRQAKYKGGKATLERAKADHAYHGRIGADKVLNNIPFEEALSIFKRYAGPEKVAT